MNELTVMMRIDVGHRLNHGCLVRRMRGCGCRYPLIDGLGDPSRFAHHLARIPHSLSYQLKTLTKSPSTTWVIPRSITDARESLMMSDDTMGSSVTPTMPR
jgi:hypothetical protein